MLLEEHPFPGVELTSRATTYAVADPASCRSELRWFQSARSCCWSTPFASRCDQHWRPIINPITSIFANKAGAKPVFAKALGKNFCGICRWRGGIILSASIN